ncbi:MAG: DUF1858 domain-containing protein [Deltaproteobacteria bacterium]|nr:MAG: DUF1858 domain-containing protein [Deltaproteobacteria bacterium]
MSLDPKMTVADVLAQWPGTAQVFFAHKLGCVGCTMAPFDRIDEVATTYGIDLELLVGELNAAIAAAPAAGVNVD